MLLRLERLIYVVKYPFRIKSSFTWKFFSVKKHSESCMEIGVNLPSRFTTVFVLFQLNKLTMLFQKVDTQLKFESVCPLPLDGVFRRPLITPINTLNKPSGGSNLNVDVSS